MKPGDEAQIRVAVMTAVACAIVHSKLVALDRVDIEASDIAKVSRILADAILKEAE